VILVDTHVVIWATLNQKLLSKAAAKALTQARKEGIGAGIASSTLWELAILISRGRVTCPMSLTNYLTEVEQRFVVFPINSEIAERSVAFSKNYPKDPTDQLIGATALVHDLTLVTADAKIRKSGEVACIW
jgi:PIN domain nuclease of toxin-antitoxin system